MEQVVLIKLYRIQHFGKVLDNKKSLELIQGIFIILRKKLFD